MHILLTSLNFDSKMDITPFQDYCKNSLKELYSMNMSLCVKKWLEKIT